MRVLVIGGGGREHALAWKLTRSPRVERIYVAPGNGGTTGIATNVAIAVDDLPALRDFARREGIDLTIVGPELPLTLGIADTFAAHGLRVFGPTRAGARLEESKAFTKEILRAVGAPTADFEIFTDRETARRYVDRRGGGMVVKADGLAAGKGVVVCESAAQAHQAIDDMMARRIFGAAGERIVIEERLAGEEASLLALTDGATVLPLASSQDHKRIGDGDTGPNTGGMGAYSPAPVLTPDLEREVCASVLEPVIAELRARGIVYRGVLYAGLMIASGRAQVLEFNARFGDPECQPLMLRLRSDLVEVCEAVIDGRLADAHLDWDPRASACVVLAAAGYPGAIERGAVISGLDETPATDDLVVFHAGTRRRDSDGAILTDGGRVLGVTALGESVRAAVARAYAAIDRIHFDGMQYRHDIGARALARTA